MNAINTRLEPQTIAYILKHTESKILLVDKEFGAVAQQAMQLLSHDADVTLPLLVTIDDENFQQGEKVTELDYEALINEGALDEPLNDIEEIAVIAIPDEKWDEVPCAFVKSHDFSSLTEQDIIDYSREYLAHFKAPKRIIFTSIPKTSTGKVQKFLLRDQVK